MVRGFTCGSFDLLHAGHVLMLEECKRQCYYLIVGLQIDPTFDRSIKNKPIQSIVERQIQLRAVRSVDEIVVYQSEADLETLCKILDINVRFVGKEYQDKHFTGKDVCQKRNIEIVYNNRDHGYSTTELRERVKNSNDSWKLDGYNINYANIIPMSVHSIDSLENYPHVLASTTNPNIVFTSTFDTPRI